MATLVHFTKDYGDFQVEFFDDEDAALDRAARLDAGRVAWMTTSDESATSDIRRLTRVGRTETGDAAPVEPTIPEVTTLHNALVPERPVKRFVTRGAAVNKTSEVLADRIGEVSASKRRGGKRSGKA